MKCAKCGMVDCSTASLCKRCGATLNSFGSAALTQPSSPDNRYPQGHLPQEVKQGQTIKPCLHCGKDLALKKWDSWNGFLVQCPHCGGLHGKRWNIRRVSLASFLFNAFSFLFTMRPPKSFLALVAFIVLAVAGNYYLLDSENIPDTLEIGLAIVFMLGPMVINAILLIKHERDLDNSAPPSKLGRRWTWRELAELLSEGLD